MPGFLRRGAVQRYRYLGNAGDGPSWSPNGQMIRGTVTMALNRRAHGTDVARSQTLRLDNVKLGTEVGRQDRLVYQGQTFLVQDVTTEQGPVIAHLVVTAVAGP